MKLFDSNYSKPSEEDSEILGKVFGVPKIELLLCCGFINYYKRLILNRLCAFNTTKNGDKSEFASFFYFNNPDGTIRWVIPTTERKPHFLHMYYRGSTRGKIIAAFFNLAYLFRIHPLIADGFFNLEVDDSFKITKLLHMTGDNSYAIFTGTKGKARTALVVLLKNNQVSRYFKLPCDQNYDKLYREIGGLNMLNNIGFKLLKIPEMSTWDNGVLISNISSEKGYRINKITNQHVSALAEVYLSSFESESPRVLLDFVNTKLRMVLDGNYLNQVDAKIVENALRDIKSCSFPSGLMHGDFTPWNMYVDNELIYLYDWENSKTAPLLFDLYHFIFQSQIYIHKSFLIEDTLIEIERVLRLNEVKKLIEKYGIQPYKHLVFYLLYILAFYSENYFFNLDVSKKQEESQHLELWLNTINKITT